MLNSQKDQANGDPILPRCRQVNVVSAGGGETNKAQLRVCLQQFVSQSNFIGQNKSDAAKSPGELVIQGDVEDFQLRQYCPHAVDVQIRPHGRVVEKNGFHMAIRYVVSQSTGR